MCLVEIRKVVISQVSHIAKCMEELIVIYYDDY
jgi:hypothetical protein